MLIYWNNGLSFRREIIGYVPQAGEVAFDDYATPTQLAAAFPDYTAALSAASVVAPAKPDPRAWLERLSSETQNAITAAAAKDTSGALLLWLLKAAGTPAIDVTSAETIAGVGALVSLGIITTHDQTTLLTP